MSSEKKMLARVKDYEATFSTVHGQRVLYDLMSVSNMLQSSFKSGVDSGNTTLHNEGMRSVALYILRKLKTDPLKFKQIFDRGNNV